MKTLLVELTESELATVAAMKTARRELEGLGEHTYRQQIGLMEAKLECARALESACDRATARGVIPKETE